MTPSWYIVTFYKFLPIAKAEVRTLRDAWYAEGERLGICGLFLVAEEGVNATLAGTKENVETFVSIIEQTTGPLGIKESWSEEKKPFKRWKVSVREEIVAIGKPSMHPSSDMNNHVTPGEWNRMMEKEDVVIIDTRNAYETDIGTFKGAIAAGTRRFNEFPDAVKRLDIAKDKKILMCCTGGIRCEKALMEMQRQGYEHVYQLQGGILEYIRQCPGANFEGECFVFDHRVAVDQELNPSARYGLCVFCGDPGDVRETCGCCPKESVRCKECAETNPAVCSKRCLQTLRQREKRTARAA